MLEFLPTLVIFFSLKSQNCISLHLHIFYLLNINKLDDAHLNHTAEVLSILQYI